MVIKKSASKFSGFFSKINLDVTAKIFWTLVLSPTQMDTATKKSEYLDLKGQLGLMGSFN